MNDNSMNWSRQFKPPGLSGLTSAPGNVEDVDLPPGAPPYAGGPLANPPRPSPTPPQQSLASLAAGGFNHAEAWMSGTSSPQNQFEQQPFNSGQDEDLPPGAGGTYYGGPLANPPKPSPTPQPNANLLKRFSFSSSFDQAQSGY